MISTTCRSPQYFHGGNTGSNPVGDAKKIKRLGDIAVSIRICGNATVTVGTGEDPFWSGQPPDIGKTDVLPLSGVFT